MKEATGELSMTVITILAIVIIGAIVAGLKEPISEFIKGTFTNTATETINSGK